MAKKANGNEAQLIMQLYELRRESVIRAARKFMIAEFWPKDYEEFKGVLTSFGTEHNAWFRQVLTYWNMAAAMVLDGHVSEKLFMSSNGEPYFLWTKFGPYIPQARKEYVDGEFLVELEKLMSTPKAKARIKGFQQRLAARAKAASGGQ